MALAGGINIAMDGVTGGHPYALSAQEAVLASRYLREHLGREYVIVTGGSYGGAAALIDAAIYPEHFDGVVSVVAPYNGRQFLSWNDANSLRTLGAGLSFTDYSYYSELDGMTMAAAQAGLRIENLDLTQLGNARVPATIILGEVDGVWLPGNYVEHTRERMRRDGVDWIDIVVADENAHGGLGIAQASTRALLDMYETVRTHSVPPSPEPVCALPRQRDRSYDPMLRATPTTTTGSAINEIWADVAQVENTAPTATATSGMSAFTGSVQGHVTRRDLASDGTSTVAWQVPVGRVVKSVAVHESTVVVGSLRGITVLNARDGSITREVTDIGSVTNVIIADIIPAVPGLEIAAKVDMDMLRVSRLTTGEVLSDSEIGTGGGMVFSDAFGPARLYAPLARGHVAGFEFVQNRGSEWSPVARWLSAYLANDLQAIAFVQQNGAPLLVAGGRLKGGLVPQTGRGDHDSQCAPALKIVDRTGALLDEVPLQGCVVNQLIPWGHGEILVGSPERAQLVTLRTRNAVAWPNESSYSNAIASVGNSDHGFVLSWLHSDGHHLTTIGRDGTLLHTERLSRGIAPSIDIFRNEITGRDELSVLTVHGEAWRITRYDLQTGMAIGPPIQRVFELEGGISARRLNRLIRKDSAFVWSSYEIFLNDGDLFADTVRVATRCGQWFASQSLEHEQLYHVTEFGHERPSCIDAWAHIPKSIPGHGNIIRSERVGTSEPTAGQQRGGLRFVSLDGHDSHFLMSTAGGNVALFDSSRAIATASGTEVAPTRSLQIGGQTTSLATAGAGDTALAVLGSWMPASDGSTLHIIDPRSLRVRHSFDAGHVLAVALANVNSDDELEVLVGTQGGFLKVFSQEGRLLGEWSTGDLHLGEAGSLQVQQYDGHAVVAFPVTGGLRVLEVRL
jgi:hypothetical protein